MILVDSSFLIALYNPRDANRKRAQDFLRSNRTELVVPEVALAEIAHMLRRYVGQRAVTAFLTGLSSVTLQSMTGPDIARTRSIMQQYADNDFDLVDCCIMALSERLEIVQIATFDRRDFQVFRPRHATHFDLIP